MITQIGALLTVVVLFGASAAKDCSNSTNSSHALKGNIVFLVDTSGSFNEINDKKGTMKGVITFLNTMARWLSVRNESGELRVALVTFAEEAKTRISFDQWNVDLVNRTVKGLPLEKKTNISPAIKKVTNLMNTSTASNNSKLVILITDTEADDDDLEKIGPAMNVTKGMEIRFITLFADTTIQNETLREKGIYMAKHVISSTPELFIKIEKFDKKKIYDFVQSHICDLTPVTQPPTTEHQGHSKDQTIQTKVSKSNPKETPKIETTEGYFSNETFGPGPTEENTQGFTSEYPVTVGITGEIPTNQTVGDFWNETTVNTDDSGLIGPGSNKKGGLGLKAIIVLVLIILAVIATFIALVYMFAIKKKAPPPVPPTPVKPETIKEKNISVQASRTGLSTMSLAKNVEPAKQ